MAKQGLTIVAAIIICFVASSARGLGYSGILSSTDAEIDGTGTWIEQGTTIEWAVSENPDQSWHYQYTLRVPTTEVSHFIIELSEGTPADHIFNMEGPFTGAEIKLHPGPSPGNPDMPADLYGIKFDGVTGTTVLLSFDAWRMPVWGDFYAKCGLTPPNQAWNMGFLDPDPSNPPGNGTVGNHILVPDTYIPEPATLLLLAGGALALRKKR
jgi:hypothetical protein